MLVSNVANAADKNVRSTGGTGYYTTIAAAVATCNDGDRIVLYSNINEPNTVVITKDITITSNNTTVRTVSPASTGGNFENEENRCLIRIDPGADVTLTGSVTFNGTNGSYTPNLSVFRVKADPISYSNRKIGTLTINSQYVTITGGHGALMANSAGEYLTSSPLHNSGGGIWINGGNVTLINGTISGNTANLGAGIYITSNCGLFNMTGGKITNNTAKYLYNGNKIIYLPLGGGIACFSGYNGEAFSQGIVEIDISGGEISYNKIEQVVSGAKYDNSVKNEYSNGGAIYTYLANIRITGGAIINNENVANLISDGSDKSQANGGAISINGGNLLIDGQNPSSSTITISGNKSSRGGFLNLSHACTATIQNVTISNSEANKCGGAVFIGNDSDGNPTFTFNNVIFSGNKNTSGGGGAIWINGSEEASTISNCTFTNNTATNKGGAIYVSENAQPKFHLSNITTSGNVANDWVWLNGGNVLYVGSNSKENGTLYPVVYISGDFNCAEENEIYLDGKTYLVKEGDFTINGGTPDAKIDIVVDHRYIDFGKETEKIQFWYVFSGRDILASKNAGSRVVEADNDKLNVKIRQPYLEEYGFYLRAVYNADGFSSAGGITTTTKDVIELQGLGMIRITRSGLNAGESAIYNITKQGSSTPLYTVQVTGTEANPTPTNEVIYVLPGSYTVTENGWDWAYSKGTNPQTKNVTNIGTEDNKAVPWTVYEFTGNENNDAVKPHDESQSTKSAGKASE